MGSTGTGEVASAATRAPTEAAAASARDRQCRSCAADLVERGADRGAEFDLLRLQLGHQVGGRVVVVVVSSRVGPVVLLDRLPLAAPCGDVQGLG